MKEPVSKDWAALSARALATVVHRIRALEQQSLSLFCLHSPTWLITPHILCRPYHIWHTCPENWKVTCCVQCNLVDLVSNGGMGGWCGRSPCNMVYAKKSINKSSMGPMLLEGLDNVMYATKPIVLFCFQMAWGWCGWEIIPKWFLERVKIIWKIEAKKSSADDGRRACRQPSPWRPIPRKLPPPNSREVTFSLVFAPKSAKPY